MNRFLKSLAAMTAVLVLGACSSSHNGKYFQNDGPPDAGAELEEKSATPRVEKFFPASLRPYTVMGKRYTPVTTDSPMVQVGKGSWYGKQFHGNNTAIGEPYNMHAMTAAHPTMPLPSYARVTNLNNGRSVIVRVNDRGPFLHDRIMDLSFAAASALGYANKGTADLRVERLTNTQIADGSWNTEASRAVAVTDTPKPTPVAPPPVTHAGTYGVQIGYFSEIANAQAFGAHAEAVMSNAGRSMPARVVRDGTGYRVLLGQNMTDDQARAAAEDITSLAGLNCFIIAR